MDHDKKTMLNLFTELGRLFNAKCTSSSFVPVKAEIASSNLVGVATLVEKGDIDKMLKEIESALKMEHISVDDVRHILHNAGSISQALVMLEDYTTIELMTITEAEEYSNGRFCYGTIANWISEGKLQKRGKRSVPRGRPKVLIARQDMDNFIKNPPKQGRTTGARRGVDFDLEYAEFIASKS